jgi:MarR family transcriptional regulator, lower aerobic nicotinate degradation pathway regulator
MTLPATETPSRPIHRVAKELVANSGFLLARLGIAFKTKALERIEQEGFDAHHYSVLAILAEGAQETQATIADALALDPSRLVALLDSLEERGLIARRRDPHDRRRHVVSITPAGKRQLQRLRAIAKQLEDEFFAPLDAGDRETFHRLLLRLASEHDPRCDFAATSPPSPTE